ncbi:phist protein [Plasmodium cynomolgi strain B]|uniref:Phist protein n=1 Tax=Plasmodium cynomolgi (strain B) TaxID=1120755 RepID=K6UCS4_PLACD|nr:phist protein [Plasmodium cynomolgi strain B]GAB65356.1 phist protein [Plasmodium cynomolgi strain B]
MSYSSSESLFVRPKIYQDRGMQVQKIYDDAIESDVHRGENMRHNIRRGGGGSSRGSRNVLSKVFTVSMFSNLLSSSPYQVSPPSEEGKEAVHVFVMKAAANNGSDNTCNLLDGSLSDIEIGEEVFEDSVFIESNYDQIKVLKYDKVIEDDEIPICCEVSDFTENMTNEEIIERINNLDDPVPFRDMFIVYNSFHENERKKFNKMQKFLFENVAKKEHLKEDYKKDAWAYISSYMTQQLLRKDFVDFNSLYKLDEEECSVEEYVNFIRKKKASWNIFFRHMEDIGRKMIYDYVMRGSPNRRNQEII